MSEALELLRAASRGDLSGWVREGDLHVLDMGFARIEQHGDGRGFLYVDDAVRACVPILDVRVFADRAEIRGHGKIRAVVKDVSDDSAPMYDRAEYKRFVRFATFGDAGTVSVPADEFRLARTLSVETQCRDAPEFPTDAKAWVRYSRGPLELIARGRPMGGTSEVDIMGDRFELSIPFDAGTLCEAESAVERRPSTSEWLSTFEDRSYDDVVSEMSDEVDEILDRFR